MAFHKGSALLLKTGTWSGGTTVGGFISNSMTINESVIETTTKDSEWRTLLAGGIKSLSISGNGLVSDQASYETFSAYIRTASTQTSHALAFGSGDSDAVEGNFFITEWSESGEAGDRQTFSFTAECDGAPTFTNS